MNAITTSSTLTIHVDGEEGKSQHYFVFTVEGTIAPSKELSKLLAQIGSQGVDPNPAIENSIQEDADLPITTIKMNVINTSHGMTPFAELRDIALLLLSETSASDMVLILKKGVYLNASLLDVMAKAIQPHSKVNPLVINRQDLLLAATAS